MQVPETDNTIDLAGPGGQFCDETGVLWSAPEGQVTNACTFVVCALTFWLVVPVFYALYRAWWTSTHRYVMTDQRLREATGVMLRRIEELELYRVKDI
ncbi:MAG: hypothetical protein JF606_28765, partial [Burkholderiales bacterium]|nr:hypothetical protein [Burkholderiales bacterium]